MKLCGDEDLMIYLGLHDFTLAMFAMLVQGTLNRESVDSVWTQDCLTLRIDKLSIRHVLAAVFSDLSFLTVLHVDLIATRLSCVLRLAQAAMSEVDLEVVVASQTILIFLRAALRLLQWVLTGDIASSGRRQILGSVKGFSSIDLQVSDKGDADLATSKHCCFIRLIWVEVIHLERTNVVVLILLRLSAS